MIFSRGNPTSNLLRLALWMFALIRFWHPGMVFGIALILCGFTLQCLQYWPALFDVRLT
jgi:hypothetical protein